LIVVSRLQPLFDHAFLLVTLIRGTLPLGDSHVVVVLHLVRYTTLVVIALHLVLRALVTCCPLLGVGALLTVDSDY